MKIKTATIMTSVCAIIGIVIFQSALRAQVQSSVLDGVFTESQAVRGENIVQGVGCDYCHGGGLAGGIEETPPLVGGEFTGNWSGQTLADLYRMVRDMPKDGSAELTSRNAVDVMAYLLWLNYYPPGEIELLPDPNALEQIRIVLP